jgi:hypothetical protein
MLAEYSTSSYAVTYVVASYPIARRRARIKDVAVQQVCGCLYTPHGVGMSPSGQILICRDRHTPG